MLRKTGGELAENLFSTGEHTCCTEGDGHVKGGTADTHRTLMSRNGASQGDEAHSLLIISSQSHSERF